MPKRIDMFAEVAPSIIHPLTVWSFPDRGDWATHVGNYRGNWSPHIPRNLILRYTQPGELVLDRKRESTYACRAYVSAPSRGRDSG